MFNLLMGYLFNRLTELTINQKKHLEPAWLQMQSGSFIQSK